MCGLRTTLYVSRASFLRLFTCFNLQHDSSGLIVDSKSPQAKSYEPEALLNFVALMGWSPQSSASSSPPEDSESAASAVPNSDNTDVLPLHDLIAQFSLEAVNKNRASMQAAKLDFLNRAHIRLKLEDRSEGGGRAELAKRARQILVDKWPELSEEKPALADESYVIRVVEALKVRVMPSLC